VTALLKANAGGSATDDYIVDCAGSAADTTTVTCDFATNITTGSVTIRGDRAAPDNDGFYDGNVVISSSHYRLELGNVTIALQLNETNSVVDGIQISHGQNTSNRTAIVLGTATATYTVRKCRLLNTSSVDIGIGNTSALNGNWTIENNLIVGFDVDGIRSFVGTGSPTRTIRHNTIYGDGTASNGINCSVTTGSPTFNVKGNAVANSGSGVDLILADTSGGGSPTNNYADNATEQFNLGTTNEIDLGATTDAWTSPGTTAASDFTVKNTSSALYNAVNPTLITTDITDFTRDGTNHDVGAFELVVAAGSTRPKYFGILGVS
jgi:uncharacterized Zn-binding protein involved in type VI secretion